MDKFYDFARNLLADNPGLLEWFNPECKLIYHPPTGRFTIGHHLREGLRLGDNIAKDLGCARGDITKNFQAFRLGLLVTRLANDGEIEREKNLLKEVIDELGIFYGYRLRNKLRHFLFLLTEPPHNGSLDEFLYFRISDLLQLTREELLCQKNIGPATVDAIEEVLKKRGWKLGMSLGEVREIFRLAILPEHRRV